MTYRWDKRIKRWRDSKGRIRSWKQVKRARARKRARKEAREREERIDTSRSEAARKGWKTRRARALEVKGWRAYPFANRLVIGDPTLFTRDQLEDLWEQGCDVAPERLAMDAKEIERILRAWRKDSGVTYAVHVVDAPHIRHWHVYVDELEDIETVQGEIVPGLVHALGGWGFVAELKPELSGVSKKGREYLIFETQAWEFREKRGLKGKRARAAIIEVLDAVRKGHWGYVEVRESGKGPSKPAKARKPKKGKRVKGRRRPRHRAR